MNFPKIYGFNKCTEAGKNLFAPSIFLGGCNLRCPYCMNSALVTDRFLDIIPIEEIRDRVKAESADFVMISGGEPTCTDTSLLMNLFEEIRSWGCGIGMSTNGVNREALRPLLAHVNYIALDIKTSRADKYSEIGGDITDVILSKSFLTEEKQKREGEDLDCEEFDFEVRTTLYPLFVDLADIHAIGQIIKKDETWVLQQFRQTKNMLGLKEGEVLPYPSPSEQLRELIDTAKTYSDNVVLRFV